MDIPDFLYVVPSSSFAKLSNLSPSLEVVAKI
jgi:hypothetical protein